MSIILTPRLMPMRNLMRWSSGIPVRCRSFRAGSPQRNARRLRLLEQLAHQPHGRPFIPARLDQQIEDLALLVDGTPQVDPPASDPHDHLVEVPSVAWRRLPLPQTSREERAEYKHPTADRFIGQVEPVFGVAAPAFPSTSAK
jgi:hypothetical protein